MALSLPQFDSVADYSQRFTDAHYWRPYVEAICARHALGPCRTVRAGLAGTFPVFIVDERAVIKLFGPLFEGGARFGAERAMYALLATDQAIPAPALLAEGALFAEAAGWPWLYLVLALLPGDSLSRVEDRVSGDDMLEAGQFMAAVVRRIHALAPAPGSPLTRTWEAFAASLAQRRAECRERHRRWGLLPAHLIDELDAYLPPLAALIDVSRPPCVLHGDLTADHLLGEFADGRWRASGIIDFGDALAGDRLYELVTLHLWLFRCDKRLLRAFLDAYGFDADLRRDFVRRAMTMTLLHEFNVLSGAFPTDLATDRLGSLAELATLMWDLDQPGLAAT